MRLAMYLRGLGLKSGVPDIIILEPCVMPSLAEMRRIFGHQSRQAYHKPGARLCGCVIELKRQPKMTRGVLVKNYPSKNQRMFLDLYHNMGHWASPAWGADMALLILRSMYPSKGDPLRVLSPAFAADADMVAFWANHPARARWGWSHAEVGRRLGVSAARVARLTSD